MIGETPNYQIDPTLFRRQLPKRVENQTDLTNPDASKTRLKAAAKELEALFIYELLKEMRQRVKGGLLGKGLGNDIYNSLFDMEVARLAAAGRGLGLGEMILRQMDGRTGKGGQTPLPSKAPTGFSLNGEKPQLSLPAHTPGDRGRRLEPSMRMPVGGRISSAFGWRADPFSGEEKFHSGIDIAAQTGQEIYPIKKGRVIFSGLTQGYGNTVVVDHEDGFISKYGHNLTNLVSLGDEVEPDQVIALVGNSGRSTGPHLHFEIHYNGKRVNPLGFLQSEQGAKG